jgi:ubiquinone/menaquinone biosynthesis C-methylase UbiE
MRKVDYFFNDYASDFDSIYGNENSFLNNIINSLFRKSMRLRFEKSLEVCQPVEGRTVLDIGCGPGHYCLAFARSGAKKVIGIDFSEDMIEIAKKHAVSSGVIEQCEFIIKDFLDYNPANKFDFTIVMGVMDYIEHAETFIKKVAGLTQKKSCFSFPVDGGFLSWQRKIRYLKRCPLYLYKYNQLDRLFKKLFKNKYRIEKIDRDFFVIVDFES